jgi:serralysin
MPVQGSVDGDGTLQTGLGGARGFGEIEVPRNDDGSLRLDLSAVFENGLNFLGTDYGADRVFVSTNGLLSFGSSFAAYPTVQNDDPGRDLIAPFWADVDTRLDGEGSESGSVWVDIDPDSDVVSITWDRVGVYRRNADVANSFQLQLYDRGNGDFDIVFRYQRLDWAQGTGEADSGARAGIAGTSLGAAWIVPEAGDMRTLAEQPGNSSVAGLWVYEMRDGDVTGTVIGAGGQQQQGSSAADTLSGTEQDDSLAARDGHDLLLGQGGNDTLLGEAGNDTLRGGDGADTLIGGDGDDLIFGGETDTDLRDVVYGGAGDDTIDGGYGNDELRGDGGNDSIAGGFGADTVIGGSGDDTLTGSAYGDEIFGSDGMDFINGGFGHDRLNGGADGDRFYHIGVFDHGSDWIQDYNAVQGDVLMWGGAAATADDFQINTADTANAGVDGVSESFVIYRPTGQIIWALVDGDAQSSINIQIAGQTFDLLV